MRSDPKNEAAELLLDMENDICSRTLARVDEQAAALGVSRKELWPDLEPTTRLRLERYLERLAKPTHAGFAPMRSRNT